MNIIDWLVYLSPLIQALILLGTAGIVWKYTRETQLLREAAQRQIEVSQKQVKATQEQIETTQRPFIVVNPVWRQNRLHSLEFQNIGNGAAINVEAIYGQHNMKIPIISSKDKITAEIFDFDYKGETVSGFFIFNLPSEAVSNGLILKIEYCNVAMMQYHTTQKILPDKVVIESSAKMGVYNPWAR